MKFIFNPNSEIKWVAQATRLCRPATGRTEWEDARQRPGRQKKFADFPPSARRVAARHRQVACATRRRCRPTLIAYEI